MTDDADKIDKLKVYLRTEFEIKDLGALKYILGIEVADPKTVFSSCNMSICSIFLKKHENSGPIS